MIIKRYLHFVAIILAIITVPAYQMDTDNNASSGWLSYTAGVLTGGVTKLKQFLSYVYITQSDPFPFTQLPQDIQNTIISLLINNSTAKTLEESTKTINALSQVNHQLNDLINDPQFCLIIIHHLANQFDCSDQVAATVLQTQQATLRLDIQTQFMQLCAAPDSFDKKAFKDLYQKYKDYIDLNFTYGIANDNDDIKMTLLMLSSNTTDNTVRIQTLLDTNEVDVNKTNAYNMTALMMCVAHSTTTDTIELLCQTPTINLDQQTLHGDTALMIACKMNKPEMIEILINNGADVTIANNDNLTPLQAVEKFMPDNSNIAEFIQEAVEKKQRNE